MRNTSELLKNTGEPEKMIKQDEINTQNNASSVVECQSTSHFEHLTS